MPRRRNDRTETLQQRLAAEAKRLREQANLLPPVQYEKPLYGKPDKWKPARA
jgi:hypothetical protein